MKTEPKFWLFLDDTEERHKGFKRLCNQLKLDHVFISHAWSADEAIMTLRSQPAFDCVWLDHDLENADPECTGQTVAEYIALHLPAHQLPRSIVIHSHNPEGARRMQATLAEAGILSVLKPFKV